MYWFNAESEGKKIVHPQIYVQRQHWLCHVNMLTSFENGRGTWLIVNTTKNQPLTGIKTTLLDWRHPIFQSPFSDLIHSIYSVLFHKLSYDITISSSTMHPFSIFNPTYSHTSCLSSVPSYPLYILSVSYKFSSSSITLSRSLIDLLPVFFMLFYFY